MIKKKLSILIPVYRGGKILEKLYSGIKENLESAFDFEVLLICDSCDKESEVVVKNLKLNDCERIKVVFFKRNYGQHRALQYGFGIASGDLIITMDEDLQHDPSDIIKLVRKQESGNFDIVYGRFNDPQHKGVRNTLSFLLRKILKHFIPTLFDNYSPYRVIRREIALRTSTMVCPYTFIDDFLSRATQNIAFEDVMHYKRMVGRSSYTFLKLVKHGLFILLAYSKLIPLLLAVSGAFILAGTIMFIMNVFFSGSIFAGFINETTIVISFITGVIFIIAGLAGSLINQKNSIVNTRPIKLLDEGSF